MKSTAFGIAALALICLPAIAPAASVAFKTAQVNITVPDGWKSTSDDNTVTVTTPDGAVAVVFVALPQEKADKGFADIEAALEKSQGAKVEWADKPSTDKLNGMEAESWAGAIKEKKLAVYAMYVDTPSEEKSLGIYWFAAVDAVGKYKADIDTLEKGITPAPVKKEGADEKKADDKAEEKKGDDKKE